MKTIELVQLAKASNQAAFAGVPDNRSAAVVDAVLAQLGQQLRDAKEPVVVPRFGRFIVRETKATKNGEEVTVRRIVFRPAVARAQAGAGAAEGTGTAAGAAAGKASAKAAPNNGAKAAAKGGAKGAAVGKRPGRAAGKKAP